MMWRAASLGMLVSGFIIGLADTVGHAGDNVSELAWWNVALAAVLALLGVGRDDS